MRWLNVLQLIAGGLFLGMLGVLASLRFTRVQRTRWPILRQLDGKQVHILLTAIACISATIGIEIWKALFPQVFIRPSVVHFNAADQTYTLTLVNNSEYDIYQLSSLLRINSSERMEPRDFGVDIPQSSRVPVPRSREDMIGMYDVIAMRCRDLRDSPLLAIQIYRMRARESRDITVTSNTPKTATISAIVSRFDYSPAPMIVGQNETGLPFKVGEDLRCSGTGFWPLR